MILARVLFSINQGAAGRRALEQAAAEAADHPDVYLNLGATALRDGRFSDALLNFEKALSLIPKIAWVPRKRKYRGAKRLQDWLRFRRPVKIGSRRKSTWPAGSNSSPRMARFANDSAERSFG